MEPNDLVSGEECEMTYWDDELRRHTGVRLLGYNDGVPEVNYGPISVSIRQWKRDVDPLTIAPDHPNRPFVSRRTQQELR